MNLPNKEKTFQFDHTSELGNKYEGSFTIVCSLNTGQRHRLELEKSKLLCDQVNPTDGLLGLAVILSFLRVHIIDSPDWWKRSGGGLTIEDEDALVALYNKAKETVETWKKEILEQAKSST